MRKVSIAVYMISLLTICISTTSYAGIEGVVAVWLFDEGSGDTVKDYLNRHNGEIQGSLKWVDGVFGKALEFPGIDGNYVSVPHEDSLSLATWTITAWVKPEDNNSAFQVFMRKANPGNVRNYSLKIYENENNPLQMEYSRDAGAGGYCNGAHGKTTLTDGNWHHVAGTYDGDATRVYLDGALESEASCPEKEWTPDTNDGPVTIGATFEGTGPVKGIMDDVGLFKRALSEDEISTVMNDGLARLSAVDAIGKLATTWAALKDTAGEGK